ncbi:MAG: hypothetical protein GY721_11385 [Deltaproteobacteria bacterium]|nr:hypothetical protein [Deltaproteobacteria bacterium]
MKKDITLIILTILMFLLQPSTACALDNNRGRILLAKLFIEDDTSYDGKAITEKEGEFTSLHDERGSTNNGAVIALRKEGDGIYRDALDIRFTSYITEQSIPQNLRDMRPAILAGEDMTKPFTSSALDFEIRSVLKGIVGKGIIDVGTALFTEVLLHEAGHYMVADYVGAESNSLTYLTSKDGQFFLGLSSVSGIDSRSRLPYSMGGEVAADFSFEYALSSYRRNPTLYNRALMLFSGTDLLRYTIYAFLLSDEHDALDPIAVTKYSGASKEALLSVAVVKTMLNAYRIYSGNDAVIPYFMVDRESATLMFRIVF